RRPQLGGRPPPPPARRPRGSSGGLLRPAGPADAGGRGVALRRRAVLGLRGPSLHAAERLVSPALAVLVPLKRGLGDRAPAHAALRSSLACTALGTRLPTWAEAPRRATVVG